MEQTLLDLAGGCVQAGFSVIPIRGDGSKAPALAWTAYQQQRPTSEELHAWFHPDTGRYRHGGLALVCGQVSGGFEVLDFDVAEAFEEFRTLLGDRGQEGLLQRVSLTHTPRPGVHLGLRSPCPERNQVLARRPRGPAPFRCDVITLCETRGQGGYVLAPGCPACCHPAGQTYRPFDGLGVPLAQLAPLHPDERALLLETARLLAPRQTELGNQPGDELVVSPHRGGTRPGDVFNSNGPPWGELLEPAGWERVREDVAHLITYWRRPGKRGPGHSATTSSRYSSYGESLFYVFSTKAPPFEAGKAYTRFAVWALLYHHGDFRAAARALREGRWAEASRPRPPAVPVSRERPRPESLVTSTQYSVPSNQGSVPNPPVAGAAPPPEVEVISLATVRATATQWLWRPWLPAGTLVVLDGDPGLGKSTLTLDLAARVTRGQTMPFEEPGSGLAEAAGSVLLLSAEDDAARTILPRLKAADADLDRVHLLGTVRDSLGERMPQLPGDLETALARLPGIRLVVVDPLMAFLGDQFDACRDQNVRRCLFALARLAERYQVVILLVRHLNKTGQGQAIYRGSGSIGILGAARACLLAGRDPDGEGQCVLAMSKCNLAARPRSLAYVLEPTEAGVARVTWRGEVPWTADDLVGKPASQSRLTLVEECAAFLRLQLQQGPVLSAELEQRCLARGWSRSTYDRARQRAGVRSEKAAFDGSWLSLLPPAEPAAP